MKNSTQRVYNFIFASISRHQTTRSLPMCRAYLEDEADIVLDGMLGLSLLTINTRVGKDLELSKLKRRYHSCWIYKKLPVPPVSLLCFGVGLKPSWCCLSLEQNDISICRASTEILLRKEYSQNNTHATTQLCSQSLDHKATNYMSLQLNKPTGEWRRPCNGRVISLALKLLSACTSSIEMEDRTGALIGI